MDTNLTPGATWFALRPYTCIQNASRSLIVVEYFGSLRGDTLKESKLFNFFLPMDAFYHVTRGLDQHLHSSSKKVAGSLGLPRSPFVTDTIYTDNNT